MPFARRVADHFLAKYGQVSRVRVTMEERVWTRLTVSAPALRAEGGDSERHRQPMIVPCVDLSSAQPPRAAHSETVG